MAKNNISYIKEYMRKYRKNNKEKIKNIKKKWLSKNPDYNKNYYYKTKKKRLASMKKYQIKNKDKIDDYMKKWKQNNPNYSRLYKRKRRNNINFVLLERLRTRISTAIKNNKKSKKTSELLGCSIEYFKKHLENQFKHGMAWDNYGFYGWHIDHIIPCAKFDLSKASEQKKCFNYSNLQPMWAKENLIKSKRG